MRARSRRAAGRGNRHSGAIFPKRTEFQGQTMIDPLVGRQIGPYAIRRRCGGGGMSTVYLGYHALLKRPVAVKVLPLLGTDAEFVRRFQREASAIARLHHPHIVPVYDYGEEPDFLFLVMRYVEGGTLKERLRRGALPFAAVGRLISASLGFLGYVLGPRNLPII